MDGMQDLWLAAKSIFWSHTMLSQTATSFSESMLTVYSSILMAEREPSILRQDLEVEDVNVAILTHRHVDA